MNTVIGKILFFGVLGWAVGCGGSVYEIADDAGSGDTDGGSKDAALHDAAPHDGAARDAQTSDAGGPIECGAEVCVGTDVCVRPCCGGILPQCTPVLDGGVCPPGLSYQSNCFNGGMPSGPGCLPGPCTPPPAYCSPQRKINCGGPAQSGSRDVQCVCG